MIVIPKSLEELGSREWNVWVGDKLDRMENRFLMCTTAHCKYGQHRRHGAMLFNGYLCNVKRSYNIINLESNIFFILSALIFKYYEMI